MDNVATDAAAAQVCTHHTGRDGYAVADSRTAGAGMALACSGRAAGAWRQVAEPQMEADLPPGLRIALGGRRRPIVTMMVAVAY